MVCLCFYYYFVADSSTRDLRLSSVSFTSAAAQVLYFKHDYLMYQGFRMRVDVNNV